MKIEGKGMKMEREREKQITKNEKNRKIFQIHKRTTQCPIFSNYSHMEWSLFECTLCTRTVVFCNVILTGIRYCIVEKIYKKKYKRIK